MVTTALKLSAPYSRVAPVVETIRRLRDKGLPNPITSATLKYSGIAEGLAYQTIQALRFLRFIDAEGNHTQALADYRTAPSDQAQQKLAELVREAYKPVFDLVDPDVDGVSRVEDAFRQYQPQGQRDRMVSLFMGLCREAGIIPDTNPEQRKPQTRHSVPRPKSTGREQTVQPIVETSVPSSTRLDIVPIEASYREYPVAKTSYDVVMRLIDQLPADGQWIKERRDRWLHAVEATVDWLVEIVPDTSKEGR